MTSKRPRLMQSTAQLTSLERTARRGVVWTAFLVALAGTQTASATTINLNLTDFTIFSNTGTNFAGANYIFGNIGSNGNVINGAGDTQVLGSIYAGGNFSMGQNTKIGSDGITAGPDQEWPPFTADPVYAALMAQVVANGTATLGGTNAQGPGTIYGNLDALSVTLGSGASVTGVTTTGAGRDTFAAIAMTPGVSFTATGNNQQVTNQPGTCTTRGCDGFLALDPGASSTYGSLATSAQYQTVRLSSGDYYFSSITAQGTFTLEVDLSSGNPININVVGDATFGQDAVLMVKGTGTNGLYVPISQAPQLAALINWNLGGEFNMGGGDANAWTTIFGGTVYSYQNNTVSGNGITFGQRIDWYGALYAYDTIDLADHSRYNYGMTTSVPEPGSLALLGMGLIGFAVVRRRREGQGSHPVFVPDFG